MAEDGGKFLGRQRHGHHRASERHSDAAIRGDQELTGQFGRGVDDDLDPVAGGKEVGGAGEAGIGPGRCGEACIRLDGGGRGTGGGDQREEDGGKGDEGAGAHGALAFSRGVF